LLLAEHRDNADLHKRFLEEAQIMGQLQHPGVPPIHAIGRSEDGRPFFAMKQVKGRTLSVLLKEEGVAELPRLLGVFEQVCQTIAYAHSRRIIHRDLKPGNIMVGAFGEVQVMDWGLAKVLGSATMASLASAPAQGASTVFTLRSHLPESDHTAAGTVLGTPAYMPPEQARGEVEILDERSDVFGLGAILCELLTGRPPFAADSKVESHRKAMRGAVEAAMARLDACGADGELVRLARHCLAPEQCDRPANGAAVAEAIAGYQAGVQRRLRQAEIDQAATKIKAFEARKRRNVSRALVAMALFVVLAGAGLAVWYVREQNIRDQRRQQLDAELSGQLTEVQELQDNLRRRLGDPLAASRLLGDVNTWVADVQRLRAAWRQSDVTWKAGRDLLDPRGAARLSEFDDRIAIAEREVAWAQKLDQVRQEASMYPNPTGINTLVGDRYRQLFPQMGFDVVAEERGDALAGDPSDSVSRSAVRYVAVAALDYWAATLPSESDLAPRLVRVAAHADPDPWRDEVRDAKTWKDPAKLKELAERAPLEANPQTIILLARHIKQPAEKQALIRRALTHHPREFWLHIELARLAKDPAECAACYRAALALRPYSIVAHNNLGNALAAMRDFAGAMPHYKKALEIDPNYARGYTNLGNALYDQRDYAEAIRHYHKALAIDPLFAPAHSNLGIALHASKKADEGIASIRKAIDIDPGYTAAYLALGNILWRERKLEAAIEQFQRALDVEPASAPAYAALAQVLNDKSDAGGVIAASKKALALDPRLVSAHVSLGTALFQTRKYDESLVHFKLAVAYEPGNAAAHHGLGAALTAKKDLDGAVRAFKQAIALSPSYGLAHQNLVVTLRDQARFAAVAEYLPTALKLAGATTRPLLAKLGKDCERLQVLDAKLPDLLAGRAECTDAAELVEIGYLCGHYKNLNFAATQFYAHAFKADRKQATYQNRYNGACYAALALAAKGHDSIDPASHRFEAVRQVAFDWLTAALEECKQLRLAGTEQMAIVRTRMEHWQTDSDLAAVRDPREQSQTPLLQYREWQRLWANVDALRRN
jgi:serine/threonine protein kinase/tetratricopeptide (TPR) repeat protein